MTLRIRQTANNIMLRWCANAFEFYNTDNDKPVIFGIPNDITKPSGHPSVVVEWAEPMATDNSGIQSLTSSHRSGSIFPVGSTPVVYTSTDPSGNTEMRTFVVLVKGKWVGLLQLKLIIVSLITYLLICNFNHMPFTRHPVQMNGETCCGKSVVKNTEMNKISHFFNLLFCLFLLLNNNQ